MSTNNYICPNCGGKGCPVCQNTGQVALSDAEVQELQKMMVKTSPQTQPQQNFDYGGIYSNPHEERSVRSQLAGILTLVFLALVSVSGFLSWFFTHTFKPFFQFWSVIAALAVLKPLSSIKFFQEEKVNDFIGKLQDEDIKIKLPPLYPLL